MSRWTWPICAVATVAVFDNWTTALVRAADWYVAVGGSATGAGTLESPWDLDSALGGRKEVAAGDTIWLAGGTYRHPDRTRGSAGYVIRLVGSDGKPIKVRAALGQRVTIDGALTIQSPASHLWIHDLELIVSENLTKSRRFEEPGSHPESYDRPWGGLNIHSGADCKYINLVIHHTAQGVSFWSGATDSELHGSIIYDNGWEAPDRGHGHAIYTQNVQGTKTISDCIMTGGYGYTMHAYGSSRAYVDNYVAEGNICYAAGLFLIGGGRPSHNIRVLDNYLHNTSMRIGYDAPYNEDCEVLRNTILGGDLSINKFKSATNRQNLVIGRDAARPRDRDPEIVLRANRFDSDRANIAIFNWDKRPKVELPLGSFLKNGDRFELKNPIDFYGNAVVSGRFDDRVVNVPVAGEFAAFVLLRR